MLGMALCTVYCYMVEQRTFAKRNLLKEEGKSFYGYTTNRLEPVNSKLYMVRCISNQLQ